MDMSLHKKYEPTVLDAGRASTMEAFARTFWRRLNDGLLSPLGARFAFVFHHVRHVLGRSSLVTRLFSIFRAVMVPPNPICHNEPPGYHLRHLKTKEECRLKNDLIEIWTVELPSKHAEGVLKIIKDHLGGHDSLDLQHLRRFAKPKYLPPHVINQRNLVKEICSVSQSWEGAAPSLIQPDLTGVWEWSMPSSSRNTFSRPASLYLLVCPTNLISLADLEQLLLQHTPFASSAESWAYPLDVRAVTVPRLPPTSPSQALSWSEQYWPTFYRKSNPFGAHPVTIAKAEDEMQDPSENNIHIADAMDLAEKAAKESEDSGRGLAVGCVVIERVDDKTEIIAVVGDARFNPLSTPRAEGSGCCDEGNIMAHAVMRAIGFVGRKRLRVASYVQKKSAEKAESNFDRVGLIHDEKARDAFFLDLPTSALERQHFKLDNIKPDGYLCLKLEFFLTHEPCVMCCMALVHSRVGRVVFKNRLPQTGGLTAEVDSNDTGPVGLGYGLCWRKELNWQYMCWEYVPVAAEDDDVTSLDALDALLPIKSIPTTTPFSKVGHQEYPVSLAQTHGLRRDQLSSTGIGVKNIHSSMQRIHV